MFELEHKCADALEKAESELASIIEKNKPEIKKINAYIKALEQRGPAATAATVGETEHPITPSQSGPHQQGHGLHSAIKAAQPDGWVSEWQPIETAPKDGTVFLGYKMNRFGPQYGACYKLQRTDGEAWCFNGESGGHKYFPNIRPTHWMPLPAAPKEAR
jgi:hypothetical protein